MAIFIELPILFTKGKHKLESINLDNVTRVAPFSTKEEDADKTMIEFVSPGEARHWVTAGLPYSEVKKIMRSVIIDPHDKKGKGLRVI